MQAIDIEICFVTLLRIEKIFNHCLLYLWSNENETSKKI